MSQVSNQTIKVLVDALSNSLERICEELGEINQSLEHSQKCINSTQKEHNQLLEQINKIKSSLDGPDGIISKVEKINKHIDEVGPFAKTVISPKGIAGIVFFVAMALIGIILGFSEIKDKIFPPKDRHSTIQSNVSHEHEGGRPHDQTTNLNHKTP